MAEHKIEWTHDGEEFAVSAPTAKCAVEMYRELTGGKLNHEPINWEIGTPIGPERPYKDRHQNGFYLHNFTTDDCESVSRTGEID